MSIGYNNHEHIWNLNPIVSFPISLPHNYKNRSDKSSHNLCFHLQQALVLLPSVLACKNFQQFPPLFRVLTKSTKNSVLAIISWSRLYLWYRLYDIGDLSMTMELQTP